MKQEDKLRNALREYYDTLETPFNNNDWQQANALLNATRRKSNARTFLLFAFFLSGLVTVLYNFSDLKPAETRQTAQGANKPVNPVEALQPGTASNRALEQKSKYFNKLPQNKESGHSEHIAISKATRRGNTPEIQAVLPTEKAPFVAEPIKQNNAVHETPSINNSAKEEGGTNIASNNVQQDAIATQLQDELKENLSPVTSTENFAYEQADTPVKDKTDSTVEVQAQKEDPIATNDNKKETAIIQEAEKAASAPVIDSSALSLLNTMELPPQDTLLAGEGIFYEAGASWLYGWEGPEKRDARGFSPLLGINYMNRINNRSALSFGLQYLLVHNLSNSSKTSRTVSYKYGEQSNVTVITPSAIHYLVAPLRFHYFVNSKNSFAAGVNLSYLLNVDASVTTYDEGLGFTANHKTVKLGGYTQGFSWFDSQLAFSYTRKICTSLGLKAEVFLGLTDVKQDQFFGFDHKERNSGAKLSLVYYAFRKK